jgi:hypothetical protein
MIPGDLGNTAQNAVTNIAQHVIPATGEDVQGATPSTAQSTEVMNILPNMLLLNRRIGGAIGGILGKKGPKTHFSLSDLKDKKDSGNVFSSFLDDEDDMKNPYALPDQKPNIANDNTKYSIFWDDDYYE